MKTFLSPKLICQVIREVESFTGKELPANARHELQAFIYQWMFKLTMQEEKNGLR